MRRDHLYLRGIVEAVDHIVAFIGDTSLDGCLRSELIQSAVAQNALP